MRTDTAATTHRLDYVPPGYRVDSIDLGFDLDPQATRVAARSKLRRNPDSRQYELVLHGEELELVAIRMNGKALTKRQYTLQPGRLVIANAPDEVTLEIETLIRPDSNTSLMGLYVSNGNFFTQCEAEGFRKITFFPDRPDVMAKYRVMLRADKEQYPVLLSNGNLIEQGDIGDVHDQRMIGRSSLHREDSGNRMRVARVGRQPVHRLGGQRHQTALAQQGRTGLDIAGDARRLGHEGNCPVQTPESKPQ
jgi:aminopeptidase N